jgi:hypothetical protein
MMSKHWRIRDDVVRAAMAEPDPMRWTSEDTKGLLVLAFGLAVVLGWLNW